MSYASNCKTLVAPLISNFINWGDMNGFSTRIIVAQKSDSLKTLPVNKGLSELPPIQLNVSFTAVEDMVIENDSISFYARFQGVRKGIHFPVEDVLEVFCLNLADGAAITGMNLQPYAIIDKALIKGGAYNDNSNLSAQDRVTLVIQEYEQMANPDVNQRNEEVNAKPSGSSNSVDKTKKEKRPASFLRVVK